MFLGIKMADYIKDSNNLIFIGPTGCGKTLDLTLIGRHPYRSLNPTTILYLFFTWNNTYLSTSWSRMMARFGWLSLKKSYRKTLIFYLIFLHVKMFCSSSMILQLTRDLTNADNLELVIFTLTSYSVIFSYPEKIEIPGQNHVFVGPHSKEWYNNALVVAKDFLNYIKIEHTQWFKMLYKAPKTIMNSKQAAAATKQNDPKIPGTLRKGHEKYI